MASLSIPTTSALSASQLLPPTHPSVTKTLQRLSRPSLLSLVLDWLDERNQETSAPYLAREGEDDDDEQDLYPPAQSLEELRELYTELQARKGSKRDVSDRILEGDWRDGISLYQLAMADMQYLYDHPTSQKWSALKIVQLESEDQGRDRSKTQDMGCVPRFHPATFLRNMQREVLPDVKAHYNLDRHPTLPLLLLRIFIIDSPYNTSLALYPVPGRQTASFDASRTFYAAFPDASPFVYVSLTTTISSIPGSTASDSKSLRKLVLDGIPKAFSRPRERYTLQSTSLSARNLEALVEKRGGGRSNAAGGGWSIYAEENKKDNPLNIHLPTPESMDDEGEEKKQDKTTGMKRRREEDQRIVKRRKLIAKGRFGSAAKVDDGKGIERLDIVFKDPFPASTSTVSELDEFDNPSILPEESAAKTRKGRRSTISEELSREAEDDDVEAQGWRPKIRAVFQGKHVFAGIRRLVEEGVIDGEKMPGWMTGEEGVSLGLVMDGRIRGNKGSGLSDQDDWMYCTLGVKLYD